MSETIIETSVPPAAAIAILHFVKSAAEFAMALRSTTKNEGQPVSVPNDAMTGFLMILDFVHSNPKGIVVNEDAIRAGMKPVIFDLKLLELLVEYVAQDAMQNPCDCPVCTAHREAEAQNEAAAVAVKH